jgi:hypothetical protein
MAYVCSYDNSAGGAAHGPSVVPPEYDTPVAKLLEVYFLWACFVSCLFVAATLIMLVQEFAASLPAQPQDESHRALHAPPDRVSYVPCWCRDLPQTRRSTCTLAQ